jgi:PST family polysaccharide transporter
LTSLLKSQRRRLGDFSVLLGRRFITGGLAFATTVQIANALGKAAYGELAYALALGSYCAVVVRYGLNQTLVRDLTHDPEHFDTLVVASVVLRFIILCVVVCGSILWRSFGNRSSGLSLSVILIVAFTSLRSLDLQPVYDAWYQFRRHAAYDLLERCLYFGFVWLALLTIPGRFGLAWIGCATGLSIGCYMVVQYRWALRRIRLRVDGTLLVKTIVLLLRRNVWMWLATIGGLSFGSFNQILLKHLQGTSELGGYAVAWQLVVAADILLLNISRMGNPAAAKVTRPGTSAILRRRFMIKYVALMLAVAVPICLPAMICPQLILRVLFRPEYLTAAPIMRVFGVYTLVHAIGIAVGQYVVSARMEKTYLLSVIIGGLLTIGMCFLLVPAWAGLGAALAALVGHSVSIALYWRSLIAHIRTKRR